MAEEFQGGVSCGGNWWNLPKNLFGSSPCSSGINDVASFDWPNRDVITDLKDTRSSDDSAGFSSSTSPEDWNQDLFHDSGRSEDHYSNILSQQVAPLDSSMTNNIGGDFFNNSFKQVNGNYPLQQQPLNSSISTSTDRLSAGFPLNSASYNYTSSLLQTLFDIDDADQPQQYSVLDNNQPMNIYSNYDQMNIPNEFLPMVNPSFSKQPPTNNHLPFTNDAPATWSNIGASFLPSTQSQFLPSSLSNKKRNLQSIHVKNKNEEARDLASRGAKKASNEPVIKRARMQTPSPLPTFKVRKEKLGDRVTALQQLVSPFGKTDTASVLHEAIEYIKFLHDQVSVSTRPYLKNGSPPLQHLQTADKVKDQEGLMQDLRSRGLCLVPMSSTFPVTAETITDFWTPIFGDSFK